MTEPHEPDASPGGQSPGGQSPASAVDVTILVITSPSKSNPSTDMIAAAISSFDLVDGLQDAAVLIVLDGYVIQAAYLFYAAYYHSILS
jgi:hypothetical protein